MLSQRETPVLHKTEPGVHIYIHKIISQKTLLLAKCFQTPALQILEPEPQIFFFFFPNSSGLCYSVEIFLLA